jgi:uroporphyrinogen decarboxylase
MFLCNQQILQVFESWAHHLSEKDWEMFAKPYAVRLAKYLKEKHPQVPLVYFANGGSAYLHKQLDMNYDALSLDWAISMASARHIAGSQLVLAGNIDPAVLYCSDEVIRNAVVQCIEEAQGRHVLNLGHGVEKDMSETAVEILVSTAHNYRRQRI